MRIERSNSASINRGTLLRLQTLSVPKKITPKYESPSYQEGRLNSNHYNARLHDRSFCPTVKGMPTYFLHILYEKKIQILNYGT